MPKFIVHTWETVEGTYEVEADDEIHVRTLMEDSLSSSEDTWRRIEQIDYQAFDVDVRSVQSLDDHPKTR